MYHNQNFKLGTQVSVVILNQIPLNRSLVQEAIGVNAQHHKYNNNNNNKVPANLSIALSSNKNYLPIQWH